MLSTNVAKCARIDFIHREGDDGTAGERIKN